MNSWYNINSNGQNRICQQKFKTENIEISSNILNEIINIKLISLIFHHLVYNCILFKFMIVIYLQNDFKQKILNTDNPLKIDVRI